MATESESDRDPGSEPDQESAAGADDAAAKVDSRYKRRVGILLAALALLGAWIAVLQTNAATNESRTAREATRLAASAERAQVLENGVDSGYQEVVAQVNALPDRRPFRPIDELSEDVGAPLDPARADQRLADAEASVLDALALEEGGDRVRTIRQDARQLSLLQSAVVEERVTWNARASQYETVLTTLAVAIFLIGFTLVVHRRIRPPIVVPGVILALYCLGWAVHIYLKPIPDVARDSIAAVAVGDVALAEYRPDDGLEAFETAVERDGDYAPALNGRARARLLVANPDLNRTLAITDASPEVVDAAARDAEAALVAEADASIETLGSAAVVAIVAADWDRAAELLDDAIEVNPLTPGLRVWRVAVAVAQGDEELARETLESTAEDFEDLRSTDTARDVVAQLMTLLEWARANGADDDLVDSVRDEVVKMSVEATPVEPGPPATRDAELSVREVAYEDGVTVVDLDATGLAEGATVAVVGWERPAPGAPWVQAPELFYVGPLPPEGIPAQRVPTERACVAVEYRFDLYVDGEVASSATAAGGDSTC